MYIFIYYLICISVKAEPPRGIILKEGELLYCETQGMADSICYKFVLLYIQCSHAVNMEPFNRGGGG